MEPQQPMMQQQQPNDPMMTNVGYIPQQRMDIDPMMSKHLDTSEILMKLKHMLLGHEYNDDTDEWSPSTVVIGYDETGKEIRASADPILPERTVISIISSLEMYLSSNTFLSNLEEDARNDIMWGVCQNLGIIWFRLGNRVKPEERVVIHSTIKDAIFLGLSRAGRKITLDAVSKMQQSHEIIQATPRAPTQEEKKFNVLGW